MRRMVFVVIGSAIGVLGAWLRSSSTPPSVDAASVIDDAGERTQAAWTASSNGDTVRQRDISPTDARYNPVALVQEAADTLTAREVFDGEPRDPAFAPILEQRIRAVLEIALRELNLEEKIRAIRIECRTLSCHSIIEVASADGSQVYRELGGVMFGDVQMPELERTGGEASRVVISNLYRPDTRDDAHHAEFLDEAMRPSLEAAKHRERSEKAP